MGTEGFATYYVRGGGADQNLILLDEAPVYNPNHVFGLFSAFNVDAIKSVTFYKDRFPERYGGRLSGLVTAHKTFLLAEPRLSLQYQGPQRWFATLSYNRNNQFIHLLSNTGLGLSTDLYVRVTDQSPAQQSDQISFGIQKRFEESGLILNVDTYRKWMRNTVAYKEGASFISFDDGPQDLPCTNNITVGKGWAYGTEFLLKRSKECLQAGWGTPFPGPSISLRKSIAGNASFLPSTAGMT